MKDAKIANNLHVASDGKAAIDYMESTKNSDGPQRPGLVLLDLNLPKINGMEVLQRLKNDEILRSTPVVVMTSSDEEADIAKAYDLQANCFITKPVDFEQMIKIINAIEDFWLGVVKLPRNPK